MNCKQVKYKLKSKLLERLNENEKNLINQHLQSCSCCSKLYSEVVNTLNIIEQEKHISSHPFFNERILKSINNEFDLNKQEGVFKTKNFLQIAAAVVLLFFSVSAGIFLGRNYIISKEHQQYTNNEQYADIQYSDYFEEYVRMEKYLFQEK